MNSDDLARRIVARFDPAQAERLLFQRLKDYEVSLAEDIQARPEVYRVAVAEGLPILPPDEAEYLRAVWADLEQRLQSGTGLGDTPDTPAFNLEPPAGRAWCRVLFGPYDDDDDLEEIWRLGIQAEWMDESGHDLIDTEARIKELHENEQ
jgi:hypothetical protein